MATQQQVYLWAPRGMMSKPLCKLFAPLMLILVLLPQGIADADETESVPKTALVVKQAGSPRDLHLGIAVTGGCVGGAVLGTVIPVFGNLVGCAVGGLAGWWFGQRKGTDGAAPQIQAAQ
ncbi:MAG: hypothetical protein AABZ84_04670 [Pseudomonadota bacterium]|mgnify:CR=1 FL=1